MDPFRGSFAYRMPSDRSSTDEEVNNTVSLYAAGMNIALASM